MRIPGEGMWKHAFAIENGKCVNDDMRFQEYSDSQSIYIFIYQLNVIN